jgi:phenylacetate-coenzyme A ligase PaaK-like adenylate-forming protein
MTETSFEQEAAVKKRQMLTEQQQLTQWHYQHCPEYRAIVDSLGGLRSYASLEDLPPLAVGLFKSLELKSVETQEVFKVLTSSGTTSAQTSRIYLDKETAQSQSRALVKILQSFIGKQRLPMLLVDSPVPSAGHSAFSARMVGAQGISLFGRQPIYLLDESMALDLDTFLTFCEAHQHQPVLIFGFTYMLWLHLVKALEQAGIRVSLPDAILLHSGGWKKMHEQAVDQRHFKAAIKHTMGITRVHDFYGMVEQTGSIYPQCEHGVLHCSDFSDILIRDLSSWQCCGIGEPGVIQTLSTLPKSYPGHNLLTEDIGMLLGEDDCPCGRAGKYFKVLGRLPKTQQRGCSDTYVPESLAQAKDEHVQAKAEHAVMATGEKTHAS